MNTLSYSMKPERAVKIPIPYTDLHINGVLRGDWTQPVVIILHGLPSSNRSLLSFVGSKYLSEFGYATLRINLYDDEPGTRDLIDCVLQTHAEDLATIVDYVRVQGTPKVYAAGHSYGGLTILSSSVALDGAILWDPSHYKCSLEYDEERRSQRYSKLSKEDVYVYLSGHGHIDPGAMYEERLRLEHTPEGDLARKDYPLLFVAAGKGDLLPYIKKYFAVANHPKELAVIAGATHGFDDTDETFFEIFDTSRKWLDAL